MHAKARHMSAQAFGQWPRSSFAAELYRWTSGLILPGVRWLECFISAWVGSEYFLGNLLWFNFAGPA